MAFSRRKILRISQGQIAKNLIERTDIQILDRSGQTITNWHNSKYGAIKTELATTMLYAFGPAKKVKLQKLMLPNSTEGFIGFNGTDHNLIVFDGNGNPISAVTPFPQVTEANYKGLQLSQNQDLLLVCTGDNPIMRVSLALPVVSTSVFTIPAGKILKASNISEPVLYPILYRMGNDGLPADPASIGMEIGNFAYPNSGTADPIGSVTWSVQQLMAFAAPDTWTVTAATIDDAGAGYAVNDIVITADGIEFEITDTSAGAALTIVDPLQTFNADPTATAVTVTGGTGLGMTVNITGTIVAPQAVWQAANYTPNELDVIQDVWNGVRWQYSNSVWVQPSLAAQDVHYGVGWHLNATAGVVRVTGLNNATLFTLTAPAGIDPKTYAEGILHGVWFDGEDAIGIMVLTGITGVVSGQQFQVRTLTGMTLVTFDGAGNKTGFTIKFSMVKVFDGDYPMTPGNPTSSTNFPTTILFYQQRLMIFGSRYNAQQMIVSQIGQYDDFTDDAMANSAFQLIIGSTEAEDILSVLLNQGIQIFTTNNEWLMNDPVISRTSGFIRNSSIGTNGVQPVVAANGVTLFPPKNGKGIIGFTYNFQSASYSTPYITLFTDLLDNEIVDLWLKRGLDSQDDTLIYITDDDGDLVVGNYLQEHEIQAFCLRSEPSAAFKQVIQCGQNVIYLAERNGITTTEIVDLTKKTAHALPSITYDPVAGTIQVPQAQYDQQELNVYDGNGQYIGQYPVNSGLLAIPDDEMPAAVSEVGFNIHSVFESNPLNVGAETKAIFKTINTLKLAVTDESRTDFLTVNGKYGRREENLVHFIRPARPLKDCRFTIENDIYPVEILSMEIELEA